MELIPEREKLLQLIREKALKKRDIILSSGKKSTWYVDLRLITLDSEGAYLIGKTLYEFLKEEKIDALGGPTLGADPICGSFMVIAHLNNHPIHTFLVRQEPKKHGRMKQIEGPLQRGSRVIIIDDVSTSGGSLLRVIEVVEKEGCEVIKVVTILDRGEGAIEKLKAAGYILSPLFTKEDLLG